VIYALEILLAFIAVMQVFDWWSTRTVLKAGGYEKFTVMATLMKWIGVDAALILKGVITVAAAWAVGYYQHIIGTAIIAAMYVYILINNTRALRT
jgi:Domain of unknown function (DUF5658)